MESSEPGAGGIGTRGEGIGTQGGEGLLERTLRRGRLDSAFPHRLQYTAITSVYGKRKIMPIIEALGLTKTYRVFQKKPGLRGAVRNLFRREYKEVRAVNDVHFSIEPGEMVAFLGPNSSGKTTTLKMLSGLIYPTSGSAAYWALCPGSGPTPSAAASRWSWARRTNCGGICPPPTASSSIAKSTLCRPTSSVVPSAS